MATTSDIASKCEDGDEQQECLLLKKLPGELRNCIYELVFAEPDVVNLRHAKLPSRNLLLTCRKVYGEAQKIYVDYCCRYWKDTEFIIVFNGDANHDYTTIRAVETLDEQAAAAMNRVTITASAKLSVPSEVAKLVDGVWTVSHHGVRLGPDGHLAFPTLADLHWVMIPRDFEIPPELTDVRELLGRECLTKQELGWFVRRALDRLNDRVSQRLS